MENEPIPVKEIQKIIAKDFQIEEDLSSLVNLSELKIKLAGIISYLLDKDMNRLLQIFYRIDLNEHQVALVLSQAPVAEIPTQLAELVIERELGKARTRLKYKNK